MVFVRQSSHRAASCAAAPAAAATACRRGRCVGKGPGMPLRLLYAAVGVGMTMSQLQSAKGGDRGGGMEEVKHNRESCMPCPALRCFSTLPVQDDRSTSYSAAAASSDFNSRKGGGQWRRREGWMLAGRHGHAIERAATPSLASPTLAASFSLHTPPCHWVHHDPHLSTLPRLLRYPCLRVAPVPLPASSSP